MAAAAQASLLGRIAVSAKLITQEQLLAALHEQDRLGPSKRLGDILLDLGYLSQAQLDWLLRAQVTLLERQRQADGEAQREAQAQRQQAMTERGAIATAAPAMQRPSGDRMLDRILSKAIQIHASDVHLHTGLPVQMRVSGRLLKANSPPLEPAQSEALIMEILTEQERADFTLTVEPTYKVRGTLQSFTPGHFVTFELFESDPNVAAGRVSLNGGSGKFEIDDVPSGRYTLRATQGELARGETAVEVKGADANGVSIALSPGVTVTGVVHLLGATPGSQPNESAGNRWGNARFGLGFCVVRLEVPGREPDGHLVAQMEASHQFSVPNVFWGQYRVRMECPGGHIVSALSGNSDLLSNPEISLQPGVAPPSIEIGLKPGGAELHGKLAVHDAPAGTGVLLVPTFAASMRSVTFEQPLLGCAGSA